MKDDLSDIRAGIKSGRYVNEASISQGIVQRLLDALGWPVYDTEVVAPEYSLGTHFTGDRRREPALGPVQLATRAPVFPSPMTPGLLIALRARVGREVKPPLAWNT